MSDDEQVTNRRNRRHGKQQTRRKKPATSTAARKVPCARDQLTSSSAACDLGSCALSNRTPRMWWTRRNGGMRTGKSLSMLAVEWQETQRAQLSAQNSQHLSALVSVLNVVVRTVVVAHIVSSRQVKTANCPLVVDKLWQRAAAMNAAAVHKNLS